MAKPKDKIVFKRDEEGNLYAIKNGVNLGLVSSIGDNSTEVKNNGNGSKKRKDRK